MLWKVQIILVLKLLSGKKVKLIIDGTILPVANANRARTQRIRRFSDKVFWTKRRTNLYSVHYRKRVQSEELHYGVLVIVLCDEDGVVYDVWFTYGSMHEAEVYRIRKARSAWFRRLVEGAEVYGDRGYEGVEGVRVCRSKEDKSSGGGCARLCEEY